MVAIEPAASIARLSQALRHRSFDKTTNGWDNQLGQALAMLMPRPDMQR
jgi:hypothetical protein